MGKPDAQSMADALMEAHPYPLDIKQAAAELRRLHEAHDWQYKMAGERLRRIEKLEAQRDALLEALKYHQEQTRPIQRTLDVIKWVEEGK